MAQIKDSDLSIKAHGGTGYERLPLYGAGSVDGISGGEIVSGIHNHIGIRSQLPQPAFIDTFAERNDIDFRIDFRKCSFR